MANVDLSNGHLWLHFTSASDWLGENPVVPVMHRGQGCYLWDTEGKKYVDAMSALFCVQVGYGRRELAEAAEKQLRTLPFATNWGIAHEPALELANRIAQIFPADQEHVFFVNSGSEAVEAALKLALQYYRLIGQPERYKIITRRIAYHGTTLGALSLAGISSIKTPFEPLLPGRLLAPNTNQYRCDTSNLCPPCDLSCADAIDRIITSEGPETVAAVVVEPVQSAGGAIAPPPDYFERLTQICRTHGIMLISDEVICAFGRLGHWTGAERFQYAPDIITFAKGVTSGYAPLGGMSFSRHIGDVFRNNTSDVFLHGSTWGGHPLACAIGLANLDLMESENVFQNVLSNEQWLTDELDSLMSRHPTVGSVRGAGYLRAIELNADPATRSTFSPDEARRLVRFLSLGFLDAGIICRSDNRDEPVINIAPPLVADRQVLGEILEKIDDVLSLAEKELLGE